MLSKLLKLVCTFANYFIVQGPVVQSIVSLTSSLRGQLVIKVSYDFITKNTDIFVEKIQQTILEYFRY